MKKGKIEKEAKKVSKSLSKELKKEKKLLKKEKSLLRYQIASMFSKAGYIVNVDAFSDNSSSWIEIRKKDNKDFSMILTFNGDGTEFEEFDVWKEVLEVVSEERIF